MGFPNICGKERPSAPRCWDPDQCRLLVQPMHADRHADPASMPIDVQLPASVGVGMPTGTKPSRGWRGRGRRGSHHVVDADGAAEVEDDPLGVADAHVAHKREDRRDRVDGRRGGATRSPCEIGNGAGCAPPPGEDEL